MKRPYILKVRGTTVELMQRGHGYFSGMASDLAIRKMLPQMKEWCLSNGGQYELRHKFVFDNDKQVMLFLLKWG